MDDRKHKEIITFNGYSQAPVLVSSERFTGWNNLQSLVVALPVFQRDYSLPNLPFPKFTCSLSKSKCSCSLDRNQHVNYQFVTTVRTVLWSPKSTYVSYNMITQRNLHTMGKFLQKAVSEIDEDKNRPICRSK